MSDSKTEKKSITLPENPLVDFSFEKMLKDFQKQVMKSGILQEIKERRYYIKPSAIRHKLEGTIKRKKVLARRRKGKK